MRFLALEENKLEEQKMQREEQRMQREEQKQQTELEMMRLEEQCICKYLNIFDGRPLLTYSSAL